MHKLILCGAGLILLLAACRPAPIPTTLPPTESPQPTETSRFQPYTGPLIRATLPPTWTPTFTPSPAPPTPTLPPTLSPTPAPTYTAAEICAGFSLSSNLRDGQHFTTDEQLAMIFRTDAPNTLVRFVARLRGSDQNLGVQAPGGQLFQMQLALARLPGPGTYDWTLLVHTDAYGDLCRRGGWFVLDAATTAEATAAATESATAEATAIPSPPAPSRPTASVE